jgi:hypothetical protein
MNIREGAKRMRRAGMWLTIVPLTLLALLILACESMTLFLPGARSYLGLLALVVPLALPGAAVWIAGWIAEGFAKEAH